MLKPLVALSEWSEGRMLRVELDGTALLVGMSEQKPFVVRDRCPHADVPLSEGTLEQRCLTCSAHGWRFDVHSGESLPHPSAFKLKRYAAQVVDGMVCVEV